MVNILVRNVPDTVHAALQERAQQQGVSLQHYLTDELAKLATRPTVDEVLADIGRRSGGRVGFAEAATALDHERGSS